MSLSGYKQNPPLISMALANILTCSDTIKRRVASKSFCNDIVDCILNGKPLAPLAPLSADSSALGYAELPQGMEFQKKAIALCVFELCSAWSSLFRSPLEFLSMFWAQYKFLTVNISISLSHPQQILHKFLTFHTVLDVSDRVKSQKIPSMAVAYQISTILSSPWIYRFSSLVSPQSQFSFFPSRPLDCKSFFVLTNCRPPLREMLSTTWDQYNAATLVRSLIQNFEICNTEFEVVQCPLVVTPDGSDFEIDGKFENIIYNLGNLRIKRDFQLSFPGLMPCLENQRSPNVASDFSDDDVFSSLPSSMGATSDPQGIRSEAINTSGSDGNARGGVRDATTTGSSQTGVQGQKRWSQASLGIGSRQEMDRLTSGSPGNATTLGSSSVSPPVQTPASTIEMASTWELPRFLESLEESCEEHTYFNLRDETSLGEHASTVDGLGDGFVQVPQLRYKSIYPAAAFGGYDHATVRSIASYSDSSTNNVDAWLWPTDDSHDLDLTGQGGLCPNTLCTKTSSNT